MSDFIAQSGTYQSLRRTNCIAMILEDDVAEADRIGWRIEQARPDPDNPLIEPAFPWDSGVVFSHGTVLKDPIDDLWKAWYSSAPFGTHDWRLTYATSEDGVNWTRPALDLCTYPGHDGTNVLIDADSGGINLYASVLVDPAADPDRRYEMYLMRLPAYGFDRRESPWLQTEIVIDGLPLPAGKSSHPPGMYRYVSPDGIRWTPEAGPVLVHQHHPRNVNYRDASGTADGAFIYQDPDGGYLAYHKIAEPMHPGGLAPYDVGSPRRRIIVRRTSADGLEFSPPEVVLAPDWRDPQDLQFMELTSTPVEGGYLGIATCYHPAHPDHRPAICGQRRRTALAPPRPSTLSSASSARGLRRRHDLADTSPRRGRRRHVRVLRRAGGVARRRLAKPAFHLAIQRRNMPRALGAQPLLGGCIGSWREYRSKPDHPSARRRRQATIHQRQHRQRRCIASRAAGSRGRARRWLWAGRFHTLAGRFQDR